MKPHILIVADGRSPTALSWIENLLSLGYEISLVSTFPCQPLEGLRHFHILTVAFSAFGSGRNRKPGRDPEKKPQSGIKRLIQRFFPLFQNLRYLLGPLTLRGHTKPFQQYVEEIQPDLVHALRIPFEGMLGSETPERIPFLMSTWGNDLTLHAKGSFLMRRFTQKCLERADGLASDTHRDIRLAHDWGLPADAPTLVVPGSGGVDLAGIRKAGGFKASRYGIPQKGDWVVNPRGIRPGSVHQDVFLAAIPRVLAKHPQTQFICPSLDQSERIKAKVKKYGLENHVFLLPRLPQDELWSLMKKSQAFVSPSSHDGTPNTLLEAMACGCFPIAGDIESLREWIEPGVNGLLVDPRQPEALADAILQILESPELRKNAAELNMTRIHNNAARRTTLPKIQDFYNQFIG